MAAHLGFIALLAVLSLASLSVLGYVESLYSLYGELVLGPGGGGLVVSSYAASPLTSIVSEGYVRGLLSNVSGVNVGFVVFSPVYVEGRVAVLRGLDRDTLSRLAGLSEFSDPCVIVGEGLASELGLSKGDVLPLYSPFTEETLFSIVCSVKRFSNLSNYEVLSSVELARVVRGIGDGRYSVAVLHADNSSVLTTLVRRFGLSFNDTSLVRRALLVLTQRDGGGLTAKIYGEIPEAYMARLGIHKDFLFFLSYSTATLVLISNPLVGESLFRLSREGVEVLRSLGLSRRSIFVVLTTLVLTYAGLALTVATLTSRYLSGLIELRVLNYVIQPRIPLQGVLFVYVSEVALLTLGIMWGVKEREV